MSHPGGAPAEVPGAQTTVQLFEQLRDSGLTRADLQRVRAACGEAFGLFAGRMHACGKPYIGHCTAVASTLAAVGAGPDLVIAGLLHGAYLWGDFGWWRVLLPLKRRYLLQQVGETVERYVYAFFTLPWNLRAVEAVAARVDRLDPQTRHVVLMRLVSDLDNLRDRAPLYRVNAEESRETFRLKTPLFIRTADQLGFPQLGRAFTAELDNMLQGTVAPALRLGWVSATLHPPASTRLRAEAALVRRGAGVQRRLRHWVAQRRPRSAK